MKLVRIKPYNPKKGYKLRTYVFRGLALRETAGWYELPDDDAAYLATVRNDDTDSNSPLAFDVCTKEEAEAVEDAEKRQAEKATAAAPLRVHQPSVSDSRGAAKRAASAENVLTTADLPGNAEDLESEDLAADATPAPIPGAPAKKTTRRASR